MITAIPDLIIFFTLFETRITAQPFQVHCSRYPRLRLGETIVSTARAAAQFFEAARLK
jgi:hypothetical protein